MSRYDDPDSPDYREHNQGAYNDSPEEKEIERLDNEVRKLQNSKSKLMMVLRESVLLQSHYAQLLNDYDGGQRMSFDTAEAWIKRLDDVSKVPQ